MTKKSSKKPSAKKPATKKTTRAIAPEKGQHAGGSVTKTEKPATPPRARDPRIPAVGTLIARSYKDKHLEVLVRESDFLCAGKSYSSLSKLASELTGSPKNGILWFGLTKREPKSKVAGQDPPPAVAPKRAVRKVKVTRDAGWQAAPGFDAPVPEEQGIDAPA